MLIYAIFICVFFFVFFQAEDGIRDLVRSRGLGDVYKRQPYDFYRVEGHIGKAGKTGEIKDAILKIVRKYNLDFDVLEICLLYTSDAADERSSVDLGGRRII